MGIDANANIIKLDSQEDQGLGQAVANFETDAKIIKPSLRYWYILEIYLFAHIIFSQKTSVFALWEDLNQDRMMDFLC